MAHTKLFTSLFHSFHNLPQILPQQVALSGFVRRQHCTVLGKKGREEVLKVYSGSRSLYSLYLLIFYLFLITLSLNHSMVYLATPITHFLNFHPNKLPQVDSFTGNIVQCWGGR